MSVRSAGHEWPEVIISDELVAPICSGIEICYQTFGDPDDEPLLLVMGLGGPMTWWDSELCAQLAASGFYVIRYDNRDTGRSTRGTERVRRSQLLRAFLGTPTRAPYSIADLARDAFGLLDHLGISAAHVAGISMGGMIAQTMALTAPERVLSLASIMSTTGRRSVGGQHPALLPTLIATRGPGREDYVRGSLAVWRTIGSPRFPQPDDKLRKRAGDTFDRGVSRAGVLRQMMAVLTQPDRTEALRHLVVPTLVMHGLADRMVHVSGGRATAAAVPGARVVMIEGWGHDLPAPLFTTFTRAIRANADRAA
ncbi:MULTISPECIES: alpha/beta fold hydrolase [unclassified Nocardioides]|uniref:alpha/beta fold hydrolase n=1 Tax=unclassified Nocardioides TaxID=2615069 RepID=UPI0007025406|nr:MULTISPECIES: alpha/beta fold hydrolase [unclassified Nocardioides]KRC59802.1 alpha/beta hydrolase [Nocardioides sp. Root79]KRC68618.1 alpha/beta hydrolase [Nocardioides sp. Root240]